MAACVLERAHTPARKCDELVLRNVKLAQPQVDSHPEEHEALARLLPPFRGVDDETEDHQQATNRTRERTDHIARAHKQKVVHELQDVHAVGPTANLLDQPTHALDDHVRRQFEALWETAIRVVVAGFVCARAVGQEREPGGIHADCRWIGRGWRADNREPVVLRMQPEAVEERLEVHRRCPSVAVRD